MKLISAILFISLGLTFFNCSQEPVDLEGEKPSSDQENLVITSSKICGWGMHFDSMSIDKKSIRYYNKCLVGKPAKEYPITSSDWKALEEKLDMAAFLKLDINTCNVCFDGCDISIAVKSDKKSHKINFGPNEVPLQIKPFVEAIEKLREDAVLKTCK